MSHTAAHCYLNPGLTRHPITSRLGTWPARSTLHISAAGSSAFSSLWNQNNLFAARSFYSFSHVAARLASHTCPSAAQHHNVVRRFLLAFEVIGRFAAVLLHRWPRRKKKKRGGGGQNSTLSFLTGASGNETSYCHVASRLSCCGC